MSKKERERGKEKGTEKNSFVITVNPLVFSGMLGFYTLLLIDLRGKIKELVQSVTGIQVVVKSNNITLLVTSPK